MATYTSTLPDSLLGRLDEASKELQIPKNKIIEKALTAFLDEIKRIQYVQSFSRAAKDEDTLLIAEEGMAEYYRELRNLDKE